MDWRMTKGKSAQVILLAGKRNWYEIAYGFLQYKWAVNSVMTLAAQYLYAICWLLFIYRASHSLPVWVGGDPSPAFLLASLLKDPQHIHFSSRLKWIHLNWMCACGPLACSGGFCVDSTLYYDNVATSTIYIDIDELQNGFRCTSHTDRATESEANNNNKYCVWNQHK